MRAKYLSFVILTLSLLSAAAAPARPAASAQGKERDDSLLVRVRAAEDGKPVGHACVTVIPKDGEVLFSKADAKGRVRFKGLTRGSYRVVVKADGFAAQKREVSVGGADNNGGGNPGGSSSGGDAHTVEFSLQPRVGQ